MRHFWAFNWLTHGRRAGLLVIALLLPHSGSEAARPFVTDDARITGPQSCQLETWIRQYRASTEYWVLPACNPVGNLELTLGAGHAVYQAYATSDYVFQAKTLFQELTPGGVGWGLAIGKVAHPGIAPGPNLLGNQYFYAPISYASLDSRHVIHVNLGAVHDKARAKGLATMGVGLEHHHTERMQWIIETFGEQGRPPFFQAGFRYVLIKNLLQIDATFGGETGRNSSNHWLSLGLRYTPDGVLHR